MPKIRPVHREIAPPRCTQARHSASSSLRNLAKSSVGPSGVKKSSGKAYPPPSNAMRSTPRCAAPIGDGARRNHHRSRPQHMVVERLELWMLPQPPCVAARHARDMRHAGHLRGEMTRNSVGLHVMGIDDIEPVRGMHARGNGGELGDEWARHRNVGLRAIDRLRPMDLHAAAVRTAPRTAANLPPAYACGTAGLLPWHWSRRAPHARIRRGHARSNRCACSRRPGSADTCR